MKNLSRLTLVFSVAFSVMFLAPVALKGSFAPFPLMKTGDAFDLLAPLILIPLYWLLFRAGANRPSVKEIAVFLIFAAFFVEGHGIHLAGNSIGHWLNGAEGTDVYNLTYFYDEVLGHYLWHLGVIGLSAMVMFRQWQNPLPGQKPSLWLPGLAGVIHGFLWFLIFVEGQTVPVGLPFAAATLLFLIIRGRKMIRRQPVILFFFAASLTAVLFLAGWGIYWGSFIEFSKVWNI